MTKLEAAVSENKLGLLQLTGSDTQLQSFAMNCCDFLLSSPWLQALDSSKTDFPKEICNLQFLGSNMQYAKPHPSQLKLPIPDVYSVALGHRSSMVSAVMCTFMIEKKK